MENERGALIKAHPKQTRILSLPGRNYPHNPYFGLFCDGLERSGAHIISVHSSDAKTFKFDIMHLHFPEHYIQEKAFWKALFIGTIFLIYAAACRLLGKKIIWTIHEAVPTKRYLRLTNLYLACVRKLVNGYVFMNTTTQDAFFLKYPSAANKKICRIRHCPYEVKTLSPTRRAEMRRNLGATENCILVGYLGEIRDYKQPGLVQLLPSSHADGRPIKIIAAGALNAATDVQMVEQAFDAVGRDRLVRLDRRLSDLELSELIQTVDVVFLPYAYGWNSGFAMLTLSCGTPVIASDIPMFREIYAELGAPWIQLFRTQKEAVNDDLALALAHIPDSSLSALDRKLLDKYLELCGHDQSAKTLIDFYRTL